jgi:type I restriction enzyme R subunit
MSSPRWKRRWPSTVRARMGRSPVKDKQQLVEELRKAVVDASAFCAAHGVMLGEIEAHLMVPEAGAPEQGHRGRVNALISPDPLRRDFFAHERLVSARSTSAVKPDPSALEFASRVACLSTLAEAIRARLNPNPPDISQVMGQINGCSTSPSPATQSANQGHRRSTCRKINFEALANRFKHRNTRTPTSKCSRRPSAPSWKG